jgi:hypothetical protein
VAAARTVTGLAPDAHLCPCRAVLLRCHVIPLHQIRGVAVETVGVPYLPQVVRAVGNRRDLLPVQPSPVLDVPEHGQDVDAAIGQLRQVPLVALGTERVVDGKRLRRAVAERHAHDWHAVPGPERIRTSVCDEAGAFPEVPDDRGLRHGPRHLDVQGTIPLSVFDLMAPTACSGAHEIARRPRRIEGLHRGGDQGRLGCERARGDGRLPWRSRGLPPRHGGDHQHTPEERQRHDETRTEPHDRSTIAKKKGPSTWAPSSQWPSQPGSNLALLLWGCVAVQIATLFNSNRCAGGDDRRISQNSQRIRGFRQVASPTHARNPND